MDVMSYYWLDDGCSSSRLFIRLLAMFGLYSWLLCYLLPISSGCSGLMVDASAERMWYVCGSRGRPTLLAAVEW